MSGPKYIAYLRVSTQRQGRSGLGLDAQREAVRAFLAGKGWPPIAEHVETESGKRNDRPELLKALDACRLHGATLVIAKLDRLTRNVPFLRSLIDAGVDVVFCDMPSIPPGAMGRFLLTQMAAVAELEAGLASERTRAALAAAKARGVKLGGARPGAKDIAPEGDKGRAASAAVRRAKAQARAERLAPIIAELRAAGAVTSYAVAVGLNQRGITAPRGGRWAAAQVEQALLHL